MPEQNCACTKWCWHKNVPAQNGAGTTTLALISGGFNGGATGKTEAYDGTSWSEGPDLATARRFMGGTVGGTAPSALAFGGKAAPPPASTAVTESWNGTSWTEVNDLNTGRSAGGGCGTQTAALYAGGYVAPATDASEEYDGTSWTTNPATIAGARHDGGAAGTNTAGFIMGGNDGSGKTTTTEEWTKAATVRSVDTT